jgi:hypothetical protein
MKKTLIFICLSVFLCASISAQDESTTATTTTTTTTAQPKNEKLVSKKGIYILPEQGEFALGIDAAPFLSYLGSLYTTSGQSSPYVDFGNGYKSANAIYGKYMLEDNKALRIRLGFGDNKVNDLYPVVQSSLTPDPNAPVYVNDQVTTLNRSFFLSVGIEKHRGKSRIQGIYGAELIFGATRRDINYLYANSMNNDFPTPDFYGSYNGGNSRIIEDNQNKSIFGGVRGFVGVEYFIAPKLSIGGEFGYSLIAQKNGTQEQISEYWDGGTSSVRQISKQSHDNNYGSFKFIGLSTDNLSGSINLFLYF